MVQADPLGESNDQKRDHCPHREGDRERGPDLLPFSVLVHQGEGRSPDPGSGAHYPRNYPAPYPCPVAQVYLGVGRARKRGRHDEAPEQHLKVVVRHQQK